jgi:hypothetical protein
MREIVQILFDLNMLFCCAGQARSTPLLSRRHQSGVRECIMRRHRSIDVNDLMMDKEIGVYQASASIDRSGRRIAILDRTKIYLSEHQLRRVFLCAGTHAHALSYLTTTVFMNPSRSSPPHLTRYQGLKKNFVAGSSACSVLILRHSHACG